MSQVRSLSLPPNTALWESSVNPPARHAGDRRFESGQSRQLSGCRITEVSMAWDHVAKVRLLLLRPINVLIVKLAKTVELHSTGEGSNPSEGTKTALSSIGRKAGSQPDKQGSTP